MERKKDIKVLVLTDEKSNRKMVKSLTGGKTGFESANNCDECLQKLETQNFDALLIDTPHLMIGETVNSYYVRTVCELVPVIVIGNDQKQEIENEIRSERIFYFLPGSPCKNELNTVIEQAAKWNETRKQKTRHSKKFLARAAKSISVFAVLFLLVVNGFCWAKDIPVSVSVFRNLTGNACNDWIGAGFASDMVTAIKKLPGVKVIEETEMNKVLESMSFGLSGAADQDTAVEKGRVICAKYSVVGSIQLFNNKAVVCYRLVNMETGEIVFCDTVQGKPNNILGLEEKASRNIVLQFENKFPAICLGSGCVKRSSFAKLHGDGSQGLRYSLLDPEEAVRCYESAINENPEFADGYLGLGDIYMRQNEASAALNKLFKAYDLYQQYGDPVFSGWAAYKIGEAYYQLSDYNSAVQYLNKALDIKKGAKNDFQVLYIYQRLADIAEIHSDGKKMVQCLERAVKASEKLGDIPSKIRAQLQLSRYYDSKDDYKNSTKYMELAFSLAGRNNYHIEDEQDGTSALSGEPAAVEALWAQIETKPAKNYGEIAEKAGKAAGVNDKLVARNNKLVERNEKLTERTGKLAARNNSIYERKNKIAERNSKAAERNAKLQARLNADAMKGL